jgi:hypothetical protein
MPNRVIVEARIYACRRCGHVFAADHVELKGATCDQLLEITDLRAWHWLREEVATLFEMEAS